MAALTLRLVKGSPLTNAELDANFSALNTELGQKLVSSDLSPYLLSATAASTYQPILVSGTSIKTINGTSLLGSGDLSIQAGVTSFNTRTGAITLSSTDVTTALGFTPYNATNPSGYITSSTASSTYVALAGSTMSGKLVLPAVTSSAAPINLGVGATGTTPAGVTAGDVWINASNGMQFRTNSTTFTVGTLEGNQSWSGANSFLGITVTGVLTLSGNTTGTHVFASSATTGTVSIGGASQTGALTVGQSTVTQTVNVASGATASAQTKTLNLGTGGVAGSTTTINIGSTAGTVTVNARGGWAFSQAISADITGNAGTVTNGVYTSGSYADPAWITSLAWTKVSGKPTTLSGYGITDAQPLDADLTAIAALTGTSGFLKTNGAGTWSVDTATYLTTASASSTYLTTANAASTYAPLASPTFTGTPAAPTAAVDTNTTQLATTAYVVGQGYLKSATAASTYQTISGMSSYLTTATAASTYLPLAGGTLTGNLTFGGTNQRIIGDFTSATRMYVQTSTTNGNTFFALIPNGTATNSQLQVFGASDPANAPFGTMTINSGTLQIQSAATGTGTTLPFRLMMSTTEVLRVSTAANVMIGTSTDNATDKLQVNGSVTATSYTGSWLGSVISSTYGGTGVNNGGRTLTINTNGGTLAFTNAATTLTIANTASVSGTNTGDQTITLTGDVTGSGTGSFATTLANSGVVAGTYTKVTVDAKGRVTTGASLASADLPTYTGTLTSSQVTTALGYTPFNSASTLGAANGGTGQTSYTDGQLLIGNSSTGGLTKATLTAGSNVTITNAGGAITISASTSSSGITTGKAIAMAMIFGF